MSSPLRPSTSQPGSYTSPTYAGPTSLSSANPTDSTLGASYGCGTDHHHYPTGSQSYTVTTTKTHQTHSSSGAAPQGYLSQGNSSSYNFGNVGNLAASYSFSPSTNVGVSVTTTTQKSPEKKAESTSYLTGGYNYTSTNTNTLAPPTQTTAQAQSRTSQSQPQSQNQIKPERTSHNAGVSQTARVTTNKAEDPVRNPEIARQGLGGRSTGGLSTFEDFLNLRTQMGFNLLNAKDAVLAIRDRIGHITHLSLDEFIMIFTELFRGKFANFYDFVDKLALIFQFVDTNNNGFLEIGETLQAFVHLFGGDEEDKIRAAFYLFDLDNSGFLDHNEVYTMIYNTIRLHQNAVDALSDEDEQKIAQIAKATSHDLFDTLDLDGDEKVSLDEFLVWYKGFNTGVKAEDVLSAKKMRDAKIQDLLKRGVIIDPDHDDSHLDTKAYEELDSANAFSHFIDDVRKKIPLDKVHVHLAVDLLRELHPNMSCNYHEFIAYLEALIKQNGIPGGDVVPTIGRKLFNALDDNKNGLLDLSEIVTGLSLLCGGSLYDKLRTSFDLFDENRDKMLDFNEASHLMHAFFKFMRVDTPYLKLANGTPQTWALALTHKLFEEVGIPQDQGIPLEVFEGWATSISKV